MIISLYGNYFLLMKEFIGGQSVDKANLKSFLESKPNLTEGIMNKLEPVVNKLVEKGLTRHSIVQAILYDYIQC